MLPSLFLNANDELKLFLVGESVFDVAKIKVSTNKNFADNYSFWGGPSNIVKSPRRDFVSKFKNYLTDNSFFFLENLSEFYVELTSNANFFSHTPSYFVSNSFDKLKEFSREKSSFEKLHMLGLPREEINEYINSSNDVVLNENYLLANFAKAKKNNTLPFWAAYLTFIPISFDDCGGFSKAVETYCNRVRHFVTCNNSDLGKRVEQEFNSMILPNSWRVVNGAYVYIYNHEHFISRKKEFLGSVIN